MYVLSNLAVLVAVWRNLAIPGLVLVLAGGAANLVAICVNGGYMPVSPAALSAMGWLPQDGYSNSRLVDTVVLAPLTDIFAMPTWMPVANVFSIGDLLIGIGACVAVVAAMHGRGPQVTRGTPATPAQRTSTPLPVRPRTEPSGGTAPYDRRMVAPTTGQHGTRTSDVRSSWTPSRANPSRGGDAKPGI